MNLSKNNYNEPCEEKKNNKGILKHGLMMVLCCMIPILLIVGLPLLGIKSQRFSSLIFLLCPLMHIGMMLTMRNCHNKDTSAT
jgi:hypothetical protein